MLTGLTVTLDGWYDAAGRALAAWPVGRVTVSDVPGLAFWVSPPGCDRPGWCLSVARTVRPVRPRPAGFFSRLFGSPDPDYQYPPGPRRWVSRSGSRTGRRWSRARASCRSGWSSG
jgi:hypothetical protein